ncbi:hypothetical protein [Chthonobacter albigriseus]|uniref:hypothetical protein n=1 Tax=Chthonobacter albigriseus TaxID=1683161 RepID=UPI0015EF7D00|nr:hypothetical protein [Chthonobacter albigriseus]
MFRPLLSSIPTQIDVFEEANGEFSVVTPVAEDRVDGRIVSISCNLLPGQDNLSEAGLVSFHEFTFSVLVVDPFSNTESFASQDPRICRPYLDDEIRPLIMPLVLQSLSLLLKTVRPAIVYRVTKSRFPAPRMIEKHNLITLRFVEDGYVSSREGLDRLGRHFWVMMRNTPVIDVD